MNQSEIWKQMVASIQKMAAERESKNFVPSGNSDFWKDLSEGIKNQQVAIQQKNNPFGKNAISQLVEEMREKIENENREKLKLYHAALDKTKNLICTLYQEIDVYVLAQEVDEKMKVINEILEELSPEIEKRNELIELIKSLRQ